MVCRLQVTQEPLLARHMHPVQAAAAGSVPATGLAAAAANSTVQKYLAGDRLLAVAVPQEPVVGSLGLRAASVEGHLA